MKSTWAMSAAMAALLAGCATAQHEEDISIHDDSRLNTVTAQRLERFRSEEDFLRYLRDVRELARERGDWWAYGNGVQLAAAETVECPPEAECPTADDEQIMVSGVRASISNNVSASITNNQSTGVDEGDIVKQHGQYLIVLQDGRLFVADTRPGGAPGLTMVDRADVYRDPDDDAWYDEMLIAGDRIIVTGYSYDNNATQFTLFNIGEGGRLTRETAYYISSDDYYDIENYASRLIGDNLIIYTPLELRDFSTDEKISWPLIRRWVAEDDGEDVLSEGAPLFDARDIYRPVQRTLLPTVHTISVCPLGSQAPGDELECRSTGFVGTGTREFFVSPQAVFLWLSPHYYEQERASAECTTESGLNEGVPSAVFQIPLSNRAPSVNMTRGMPRDQFSLDSADREFRALLRWDSLNCQEGPAPLRYFSLPLNEFTTEALAAPAYRYIEVPNAGDEQYENRFIDDYLVYGGRENWHSYPPDAENVPATSRVVAVSTRSPRRSTVIDAPHTVIRMERAGDNAVFTGYRDREGLGVSLLDLHGTPHLASTTYLSRRYESEGRSHAFNASVDETGAGLFGVPTVMHAEDGRRWWWRSEQSDVSFFTLDAAGQIASAGELRPAEKPANADYECEVSCVDWYGNSRPIFTDGRIFALAGTHLIEGVLSGGQIEELRRADLTVKPGVHITPVARIASNRDGS